MIHISQRMKRLGPETAFLVLAKAKALESIRKTLKAK